MASPDIAATLAAHDTAINGLSGRMGSVETGLRSLQGEVHQGFNQLGSKLDKLDARPQFDFHQTMGTIVSIAILFSMIVGGIIWITTSQNAAYQAKQDAINDRTVSRLDAQSNKVDDHDRRISKAENDLGRWSTFISAKGSR